MRYPDDFIDRIICGDCLEILRMMPDRSVDLVVTSPPYNLRNSTGNGMKDGRGSKWANAALRSGYSHFADALPHRDYVAWQRACLREMLRVLTAEGALFYNHKWRVQNGLLQDRQDILRRFPVRQVIIWKRKGGINFNPGYFLPCYEVVYLVAREKFRLAPQANACGDVWEFPQERNNPHPAPFPLALAERIIGSTQAQIVLDPFVGSGTTAVAALRLGRHFIGIDISAEYCDLAKRRLQAERSGESEHSWKGPPSDTAADREGCRGRTGQGAAPGPPIETRRSTATQPGGGFPRGPRPGGATNAEGDRDTA
jgi:site-specific DNA-methyltransferase (adenine-specific)